MNKLNKGSIVSGIIIISVGVMFLLRNSGYLSEFSIGDLWPSIFILIGLVQAVKFSVKDILKGLILTGIGTLLLLKNFGYISYDLSLVWPVAVILIGVIVLLNSGKNSGIKDNCRNKTERFSDKDYIEFSESFGEYLYNVETLNFSGGNVSVFMGSLIVDLRKTVSNGERTGLNVSLFMGEIKILVPEDWNVSLSVSPYLADVKSTINNKSFAEKNILIEINGKAVLGAVEISN